MEASKLPQDFVYLSQIHSKSLASEIQGLFEIGILNFYIRRLSSDISRTLMLPCKGWCPRGRGDARES